MPKRYQNYKDKYHAINFNENIYNYSDQYTAVTNIDANIYDNDDQYTNAVTNDDQYHYR
jgi:hypothetical protein